MAKIMAVAKVLIQFFLVCLGFAAGLANIQSMEADGEASVWRSSLSSEDPSCFRIFLVAMRVFLIAAVSSSFFDLFVVFWLLIRPGASSLTESITGNPNRSNRRDSPIVYRVVLAVIGFVMYLAVFVTTLVLNYHGLGSECPAPHDADSKFGFGRAHIVIIACLIGTGLNIAYNGRLVYRQG